MKKTLNLLIILIIGFFIFANKAFALQDIVSHRIYFHFLAPPNQEDRIKEMYMPGASINNKPKKVLWKDLNPNHDKFLFMYFFDIYCPYTIKNIPTLHQVLAYIQYYYKDLVKPILVEALPRQWLLIENFVNRTGLSGYPYYRVPSMDINEYLHVKSTPTVIIMDPAGNIVDKIEANKVAAVYTTHLDWIIGNYLLAHNVQYYNGMDVKELINLNPKNTLERIKTALVEAGILNEEDKLNYTNEQLDPLHNNKKEDEF